MQTILYRSFTLLCLAAPLSGTLLAQETKDKPAGAIEAADPQLGRPVDFERDVYPILDAKCVACHNLAINENGLNLEDVKHVLKGGKRGPSVVAKDPEKSLLFKLSSRAAQPAMPPLPNKVEAAALTPKELGIIKQWILEGANAGMGGTGNVINWQPLPKGVHPIYATALTADGQFAAAGRGNQIAIYHVPTGEEVARLADPNLLTIQYNGKPMYEPGSSHRDFVHSLAFNPAGNMLASGSYREVKLWTRPDNVQRLNLASTTGPAAAVAVSDDNKWLAVAAADHSIKLFNLADGQPGKVLTGHAAVVSGLTFSPDGAKLYSASHDKTIRAWNVAEGTPAGHLGLPANANGIAVTHDGAKLIVACADNMIRVFGAPAAGGQLAAPAAPVVFLRVSPDKKTLALAEADGKITLIELPSGKVIKHLAGHTSAVSSLAFSANSAKLVSGGADKSVRVWDVASGQALAITAGVPNPVTAVAFHPNLVQVAAGFSDGQIALFKVDVAEPPVERMLVGNTKAITGLAYAPGGEAVYTSSEDGTVRRYQTADGAAQWGQNHGAPIHDLALSADGALLATAGENNQVRIWMAANGGGGPQPALAGFTAPVRSVAFSLDNLHLASGTANNQVWIHDVKTAVVEQMYVTHAGSIEALAAAGETGKEFITSSADKTVRSFALSFERQIPGHGGPVTSVAVVPPQSARILSGSDDGTVRVWDLANGNQAAALAQGGPVTSVAVSSDGQRYASAGANNIARLWNAANNQQIAEMKGELRANRLVAKMTADDAEAKAAVTVAMNAIPAAEKVVTERTEAQKKATEAKVAAEKTDAEMAEKAKVAQAASDAAKKAADDKKDDAGLQKAAADALKAATDAAAAAKKAADDKAVAVKALEQADKAVVEANAAVAKAKTDHDAAMAKQKGVEAAFNTAKMQAAEKEKPLRSIRFSRDGKELAVAGDLPTISTFDGLTGAPFGVLDGHTGPVLSVAYAAGRALVSAAADQTTRAWDLNPPWTLAGVLRPKKEAPQDLNDSVFVSRVLSLAFSPDGALLATGGGDPSRSGELMLWDVANRAMLRTMENAHSDTVFGVEFSRDGQFLLTGAADKFVKIHEVATGKLLKAFEGHTNHVLDVAWRYDGKQIASAGADNAIKVWSVETGEQQRTIGGYTKQVTSIQYLGRGPNFVSCGGDKTVRFHQADNGNNFRNFAGATDFMFSAAGSDDEKVVVAAGQDGVLRIWNGTNAQVIKLFEPPKPPENQQAQAK
ncbi:MAG: c-type cytochrome domain-containing protein [Planctomycetales bacterium]